MKTCGRGIRMLKITMPQENWEMCSRNFRNRGWNSKLGKDFGMNPAFKGLNARRLSAAQSLCLLFNLSNPRPHSGRSQETNEWCMNSLYNASAFLNC